MRRWARSSLTALAVAAALGLAGARARSNVEDLAGPPPPIDDAGPFARTPPPGAVVAHDEQELVRLLADGPPEVWLEDRTYRGDFTIARPLALRGTGKTILEGTGTTTVVSITADHAVLDDVTVQHSGRRFTAEDAGVKAKGDAIVVTHVAVHDVLFGVDLAACPHCVVEHTRVIGPDGDHELRGDGIKLWESHDAIVRSCVVEYGRDLVVWYSRRATLEDNIVRHGRYGTHFMYSHDAVLRRSRLENNIVGIFVMYSARLKVEHNVLAGARGPAGMGIGFKESDGVAVDDNWIVANTTGIYLDRTPRNVSLPVVFSHNVLALNNVAVRFLSSQEGLTFSNNDFHHDVTVVEVEGGGDAMGTTFSGNHWSDYEGYDLDGDGTGDVPYELKQLSSELTDAHPSVQFFEGTGALGLVDTVARAVPVLASHTLLVDRTPSMKPQRPR
ncbi:MAG TPA: nitrous oxide reductase family maturation protein NosD [Polyangiaceae bacterium]|nr:nitrous oxide reductase family maturation protein NosD [Polyangiaceae bacterium]